MCFPVQRIEFSSTIEPMISVDFWQNRYETEETPWDLGGPSPHWMELLAAKPEWLKPGKMAVPGSGRGHDAALFGQANFDVVGFDYSPGAVERANKLYDKIAKFEQADIFNLATSPWAGQFDYVLEHTCFCAILPKQRTDYVQNMQALLKPGGYLFGIFWEHGDPDGPPFSTNPKELETLFGTSFELISSADKTPASDRSGIERLVVFRKK